MGDRISHEFLVERLAKERPDDIVISEEGADDRRRLDADRVWIVDPLDGTHDFPYTDSIEWAVHVALVEGGRPAAAAVAVPGMGRVFATTGSGSMRAVGLFEAPAIGGDGAGSAGEGPALDISVGGRGRDRDRPLVISGRSAGYAAAEVAEAIGGELTACGSAGVKAMLVVAGAVDVYVHASVLWEWDVCAPAAVAEAAGFVVTDIDGDPIEYNKPRPTVRGLVVASTDYASAARDALDRVI